MSHRLYSPEKRAEVLKLYSRVGFQEAVRQSGVSSATLARWVEAAGIDRSKVHAELIERNGRAAAASAAKRSKDQEEARTRIQSHLMTASEMVAIRIKQVLAANSELGPDSIQPLANLLDKAIRNMELLSDRPTSRVAIDVESQRVLNGVGMAIKEVLPLIAERAGHQLAEEVRVAIADGLRRVADRQFEEGDHVLDGEVLELEAGKVEETDDEEAAG